MAALITFITAFLTLPLVVLAGTCDVAVGAECPITTCSDGDTCGTTAAPGTCSIRTPLVVPTCNAPEGAGDSEPAAATTIAPRNLPNPLGVESIPGIIGNVVTIFTGIAGSVALLMFVYGGVMWLLSGGAAEKIEKGKKAMVWAVIGLAIIFGAYAILRTLFLSLGARL